MSEEEVEPTMEQVMEGTEESTPQEETIQAPETEPIEVTQEKKDGVQARFNKITAEKYEARREAEALQKRVNELEAQKAKAPVSEAPKIEDFDYDQDAFSAAFIKYQVGIETANQQKSYVANQAKEQQRLTEQQAAAEFSQKVSKLEIPDYVETVKMIPQLQDETLLAIYNVENGPEVAYHLGKHLDVADSIAHMPPMQAAMEIGRISANLNFNKTSKKPTTAPDPIKPIGSGGVAHTKAVEDMSMDEIAALP